MPSSKTESTKLGNKGLFITVSIVIVAIFVDTSIAQVYSFTGGLKSSNQNISIFTAIVITYVIGQYLILRSRVAKIRKKNFLYFSIAKVQYFIAAIVVLIIVQMLWTSSYSLTLFRTVIWTNYILAALLLVLLALRFLTWYRSSKNHVVMAYTLAVSALFLNAICAALYVTGELSGQRGGESIELRKSPVSVINTSDKSLRLAYFWSSISSFILLWSATVLLLRHYSKKLGRVMYWVSVSIPLIYFLSQFQYELLDLFEEYRTSDPITFSVIYTLVFSAARLIGGILFGIAFWSVARNVEIGAVKDYMMISAYGLVILFASNQPVGLTLVPFPPFGLATISFIGIGAYLMYVGIYSSAVSVAEDSFLRKTIRKSVDQHFNLLDRIGTAEMEQEVLRKVLRVSRDASEKVKSETGVEPSLQEEDEARKYLDQVVRELSKNRKER